MTSSELNDLIEQWENAKVDFKRELWNIKLLDNIEDKQEKKKIQEIINFKKNELIKDIFSLTNGDIYSMGKIGYIIIGIDDRTKEICKFDIETLGKDYSLEKFKKELLTSLNNYAQPEFLALNMEFVDEVLVISIPPRGSLISLSKDLQLKNKKGSYTDKKGTTYYRVGEDIRVASSEVVGEFEKALIKFEKDKKVNFFWKLIGVLFISFLIIEMFIYNKDERRDNSTKESVLFQQWDEGKAEQIVLNEINKYVKMTKNNFDFNKSKQIFHNITNFLELEDINQVKKVSVISTISEDYDCHACAVKLSFIEFRKVSSGWILGEVNINVIKEGSWGSPPDNISILSIGYNKFAIQIGSSFGGQGDFSDYISIYTRVAGKFKSIFDTEIYNDNSGGLGSYDHTYYSSWDSNISFRKEGTSYYEMSILKKGIRKGKKFKEKIFYKFDGINYIKDAETKYILSDEKLLDMKKYELIKM